MSLPSPDVTRVCHTIVRLPRWTDVHSPRTVSPARPAARKFVFDSIVVVPWPATRCCAVAKAPSVSAKAMSAPP
jgi:hypothetical protein